MATSPPDLALTPEEEQAARAFLAKVNQDRLAAEDSPLAWGDAVKFVVARKFDTDKALELFQNYCKTRIQEGLLYIDPYDPVVQNELNSGKFSVLARRDTRTGAAIALFTASLHCPLTASHQSVLKGLVFQLDIALESLETQRNGIIFIYDMTESKYSNFDYELSVKILHLLKGSYPAKLKKVLIVAAPLWFKAPFKVLQLFVREKLRDRIYTVSVPQISDHISLESLPFRFGGVLEVNHELWIQHCLQRASVTSVSSAESATVDSVPSDILSPPPPSISGFPDSATQSLSHHHHHRPLVSNAADSLTPRFDTCCHIDDGPPSNGQATDNRLLNHNHSNFDNHNHSLTGFPSVPVNQAFSVDNGSSNGNNTAFLSHGNPLGFLSGRVLGSDIEKFVMDDQEKENGILQGSATSRKRSLSSSPTNSTADLSNVGSNNLMGNGSQETNPQLPDKKIKAAEDTHDSGIRKNNISNGDEPRRTNLHRAVGNVSLLESSSLEPSIHDVETEGMTTEKLVNYVRLKGKKGLMRLYGILRSEDHEGSYVAARYRQNMHKNRYMDVLALDHSRVHLSVQNGDPYSEYINANYVDGYRHKKAYISTQGPLAKTYADFWRMVWECQSVCIVMTTRCVERRTIKCGRYWPNVDEGIKSETYDNITVAVKDVESFGDYIVTELLLTHSGVGIVDSKTSSSSISAPSSSAQPSMLTRRVYHLQFLSWPDYGVPLSAAAMLDFVGAARDHQRRGLDAAEMAWRAAGGDGRAWRGHPEGPPIVIHCSAGIGRTGTFVATDISTRRLEDIGTVDVDKTVRRIRTQRASSIQMPDQYVFIHQAVLEYAQREGLLSADAIRLDGFDEESDESPDDST